MRMNFRSVSSVVALAVSALASPAFGTTALTFTTPVNVSLTPTPTEKAKVVRLNYQDGSNFRKAWLYTYGDGEPGRENVYARSSFDDGVTWSEPVLLSKDGGGYPTGGQYVITKGGFLTAADNNKPTVFAPPATSGAKVVITWTSAYCPQDPTAGHIGPYTSAVQGQSDMNQDGVIDHPYYCMWVATTTDPALQNWTTTQLTNGARDAIGNVEGGNSTGTGFALAWQEDPAGLQPGEAEGPGDGGSGAHVTPGTNIWYSYANSPSGTTFRTNIRQLSDNNGTDAGMPGASRPNLQMSGSTAVVAYEETACPGGTYGKCIVFHSFPYNTTSWTAADAAGTNISDVTQNARRVRFVLQGANAAPNSPLRMLVLWRESAPASVGGMPADIVIRRGLAGAAGAGSSGFTAADLLADTPQKLTNVVASGGNANAHRAIIRDGFAALAWDETPDMVAADPARTNPPKATYNLYLRRSTDGGATWAAPTNVSKLTDPATRVVEPRLVPTPGTIVNPITGTPDAGDTQNTSVFLLAYATAKNDAAGTAGRVYVTRSTDQGATLEPFVPVSTMTAGQSETQLRAAPDGQSAGVLWMQELSPGNVLTKDTMFAQAIPGTLPEPVAPSTSSSGGGCTMAGDPAGLDPLLPAIIGLALTALALRRRRTHLRSGV